MLAEEEAILGMAHLKIQAVLEAQAAEELAEFFQDHLELMDLAAVAAEELAE